MTTTTTLMQTMKTATASMQTNDDDDVDINDEIEDDSCIKMMIAPMTSLIGRRR